MIHITVTVNVRIDRLADFLALATSHAEATRREDGCVRFDLYRCFTDPYRFQLSETFIDRQAVNEHRETPHYQYWRQKIGGIELSPREHHEYESLDCASLPPAKKINRLDLMQRASASCSQTVVLAPGCFDLLGPHHVDFLERAKALGTMLVVGLNDDASVRRLKGPTRPIVPCQQRALMLAALTCVDWVLTFAEDTPVELVKTVKPAIIVKGHEERDYPEAAYARLVFLPKVAGSTTATIGRIKTG